MTKDTVCDFCGQVKKKVYTDYDRLICNSCMEIYLQSLRYRVVQLSANIRLLNIKHEEQLEKGRLRYEALKGYLDINDKHKLPKDLEERKRKAVQNIRKYENQTDTLD